MTWALSRRGVDFEGGESLLVEQRPRAQSRGEVIALEQGRRSSFPRIIARCAAPAGFIV